MPLELDTLLAFAVAALLVSAVPGPDVLLVVTSALRAGVRGGAAAAFGVTAGMAIHTIAAALGLSALIASSAAAFDVIRIAGATYLLWLAYRAFRNHPTAVDGDRIEVTRARRIARQAALTNLLNPKVILLGRQRERFAMRATPPGADRFAGLDWEPGRGDVPLLTDALACLECELVAEHPAGDHSIVVGRVDDLRTSPSEDPLVFFAGAFGALQQRQ